MSQDSTIEAKIRFALIPIPAAAMYRSGEGEDAAGFALIPIPAAAM